MDASADGVHVEVAKAGLIEYLAEGAPVPVLTKAAVWHDVVSGNARALTVYSDAIARMVDEFPSILDDEGARAKHAKLEARFAQFRNAR